MKNRTPKKTAAKLERAGESLKAEDVEAQPAGPSAEEVEGARKAVGDALFAASLWLPGDTRGRDAVLEAKSTHFFVLAGAAARGAQVPELDQELKDARASLASTTEALTRLTTERDAALAQVAALRRLGGQLANTAFNLARTSRGDLTAQDKDSLGRGYQEWDAHLRRTYSEKPKP